MDDMHNMDESMDAAEQVPSGISRREMIKASVIAGGLVWTAPVLLSGRAFAQNEAACCPSPGTPVTITIPRPANEGDPVVIECGVAVCLSDVFDCDPETAACLMEVIDVTITFPNQGGAASTVVHVDLDPPGPPQTNITVLAAAVQTTNPPSGPGEAANGCLVKLIEPAPGCGFPSAPNEIVIPGNAQAVTFTINEATFGQVDHVELTLCLPATFTTLC